MEPAIRKKNPSHCIKFIDYTTETSQYYPCVETSIFFNLVILITSAENAIASCGTDAFSFSALIYLSYSGTTYVSFSSQITSEPKFSNVDLHKVVT